MPELGQLDDSPATKKHTSQRSHFPILDFLFTIYISPEERGISRSGEDGTY